MDVAWYRIAPVICWVSRSMSRNGSKRMTMCDHLLSAEVSLSAVPPCMCQLPLELGLLGAFYRQTSGPRSQTQPFGYNQLGRAPLHLDLGPERSSHRQEAPAGPRVLWQGGIADPTRGVPGRRAGPGAPLLDRALGGGA